MSVDYGFMKGGISTFPRQKRTRGEKNTAYYKECINAGDAVVASDFDMGLRASMSEKVSNYNLLNDIVDSKEVARVINPNKIEAEFTNVYKNYPLANPYINHLVGEERKRFFSPIVTLSNPDLINAKVNDINAGLNEYVIKQVLANQTDQQKIAQEINRQAKWANFNYRDRRERMASQVLQYGFATMELKEKLSQAFEDLLVGGEEIAVADIMGGEPLLRKGNPLNFYTLRAGESNRFEDSDLIVEASYIPVGQAIDEFFDELKPGQIKKLEEGYSYNVAASSKLFKNQLKNPEFSLDSWLAQSGGLGEVFRVNRNTASYFSGGFDQYGNVRKLRVVWRGMRKLGVLSYFDENGDLQKKYVDEDYPIDQESGENVKWIWVSEWQEGTKLADDIYVKMGTRPVQFRSMDNPSKCHPGIVGTVFNINSSVAKSLTSLMKPYQHMYNSFMYKLWEETRTFKGKIARIQTSMIPDGWTMDQFLYYMEQLKIVFEDPFNVCQEGAAMGKLAGNMNQPGRSIEIGDPQVINQLVQILNFIELRLQDISGITPQRKGAIEERETVGGVERSVTQSSLTTEKYFGVHDNFRIRALTAYLETAKHAWRDQKFKRQFILDDGSQGVLDFDGAIFKESEYGVHITTASTDMEMMQALKGLVQPFLQNGGSLAMVMELYRTKDPASLQRKLERFEQEVRENEMRKAEQVAEQAKQVLAEETRLEEERIAAEERQNIRDNETRLRIAGLKNVEKEPQDTSKEDSRKERETRVKERMIEESIRSNKANENLKEKQISTKKVSEK